jgi:outer membrane lipoprotein
MGTRSRAFWLAGLSFTSLGCAGPVHRSIRQPELTHPSLAEVREDPNAFQGKGVVLGGTVLDVRSAPDGTLLLVLEKPLDSVQRPKAAAASRGRFLARLPADSDPGSLGPGASVTLRGEAGCADPPGNPGPCATVVLDAQEARPWPSSTLATRLPGLGPDPRYPLWYDPSLSTRPWPK